MKYICSVSIVLFALLLSCHPKSLDPLQREIDDISKHWVPDHRTGICNLMLVSGSGEEFLLKGETVFPGAKAEVLKLLTSKGVSVTDSVIILPDTLKTPKNWGVVALSAINLRSKPANSAELVSQAIMGTPVRILKEADGWLLIQTPDRYIAWTSGSSVQPMTRAAMSNWRMADRMIYTDVYGLVYQDIKATKVMSDLVAGAIVIKIADHKDVTEVVLPDGRTGFVSSAHWLDFKQWKDTVSLVDDKMISTGEQFMGFPYLWGGTSSKAIDCSGFVKTVCFLNGVILERDASQQVNHGVAVDLASGLGSLQKGDLLFFGSKQPHRIVHVGMYIGDSEFIHSSGSVRINSLEKSHPNFSEHHLSTLLDARRIIGLPPEQGYVPVKLHNWY